MRYLTFWIIGCLMVGGAAATHKNYCPNDDETSGIELFGFAATWPAAITYILTVNKPSKVVCKK